jgi:2-keto-4-pentenoate hydratase/2-oxohepta-3-ene-1,7-dioic acid hydratase in catechol pathway
MQASEADFHDLLAPLSQPIKKNFLNRAFWLDQTRTNRALLVSQSRNGLPMVRIGQEMVQGRETMKFATIQYNGRQTVAVVDPEAGHAWPIDAALGEPVDGMLDLIRRFDEIKGRIKLDGQPVSLAEVRIEAPIPRPFRNILCVGKNYHEHAHEFTRSGFDAGAKVEDAIPKKPIIFTKPPETVIADGDPIRYPHGVSDSIDYEAELGVVIGKGGRGISKADAYSHVLGRSSMT